jgi:hypothetical protein
MDSVKKTQAAYWKIFWKQPEIADSAITRTQRELMPLLVRMLGIPESERVHQQAYFGSPVTLEERPIR